MTEPTLKVIDILHMIFKYCSPSQTLALSSVCKAWNNALQDESVWKEWVTVYLPDASVTGSSRGHFLGIYGNKIGFVMLQLTDIFALATKQKWEGWSIDTKPGIGDDEFKKLSKECGNMKFTGGELEQWLRIHDDITACIAGKEYLQCHGYCDGGEPGIPFAFNYNDVFPGVFKRNKWVPICQIDYDFCNNLYDMTNGTVFQVDGECGSSTWFGDSLLGWLKEFYQQALKGVEWEEGGRKGEFEGTGSTALSDKKPALWGKVKRCAMMMAEDDF
eukprot:TRINITY_DN61266_c0_g1_i1.p1 TRINITY_DN61266_c0_g1~~TRINITY_DN61266_c0_g1_i1.p1  ORF type:complete len:274 (+),score=46.41 TRINITY_DN61266_c0_g1_i1:23-844(+)